MELSHEILNVDRGGIRANGNAPSPLTSEGETYEKVIVNHHFTSSTSYSNGWFCSR